MPFLLLPLLLLFLHCAPAADSADSAVPHADVIGADEVPADFLTFYDRFMTDSVFQRQHIQFPLAGDPGMARPGVATTGFYWEAADWKTHRYVADQPFQFAFVPVSEDLIIEKILHENGQFAAERRFLRTDDGWQLIFYADLYMTGE